MLSEPHATAATAPSPTPQSATSPGKTDPHTMSAEILGSFKGSLRPVKVEASYQLATLLVAFAMVLLPMIYLALIGAVGWAVARYAVDGLSVFNSVSSGSVALFIYGTPLFVGAVAIIFLVKPLFAQRPKAGPKHSLDPAQEPVLFQFVERLCREVGAPIPSRIDVDCQVNASARFRRGFLSMASTDLVLTIGLPLVHGLSLQQLAGVLAHELGHFAQGAGMRLSYVVRSINTWFARVVYERDSWDQHLENSVKKSEVHIFLYLAVQAARGMVWLTRRVLWLLMHTGHALSCFLLRQMEFDADRYEARLVGAETFAETARRLHLLSAGHQEAMHQLAHTWQLNRLVDDLPELITIGSDNLEPSAVEELEQARLQEAGGTFDTHPTDADRVASAQNETDPPVFQTELAAGALFSDARSLAKKVTREHFESMLDQEITDDLLVGTQDILKLKDQVKSEQQSLDRLVAGAPLSFNRCLPWNLDVDLHDGGPHDGSLRSSIEQARANVAAGVNDFTEISDRWNDLQERLRRLDLAEEALTAGATIDAEVFGLTRGDAEEVAHEQLDLSARSDRLGAEMVDYEETIVRRFSLALKALAHPIDGVAAPSSAAQPSAEIQERDHILVVVRVLAEQWHLVLSIQSLISLLAFITGHLADAPKKPTDRTGELVDELKQKLIALADGCDLPCRLEMVPEGSSLGQFLIPADPTHLDSEDLLELADGAGDRTFEVFRRALTRLAVLAEQGEARLGFEPTPIEP